MSSQRLTDRAARALRRTHIVDHLPSPEEDPPRRHRHRGQLAQRTASLLGIDPADVVVTDDPDRNYDGHQGFLITVYDGHRMYRFVPNVDDEAILYLLWFCAGCGRVVPAAEVTSLVDFGRLLAPDGAVAPAVEVYVRDPAHAPDCARQTPWMAPPR